MDGARPRVSRFSPPLREIHINTSTSGLHFCAIYHCPDPSKTLTLGFNSWDEFFTRQFKPAQRPLCGLPSLTLDPSFCVIHPGEATLVRFAKGVAECGIFWLKSQPYSLIHMLDGHGPRVVSSAVPSFKASCLLSIIIAGTPL